MKKLDEISAVLFVCSDFIESGTCVLGDNVTNELASLNLETDIELLETYRKRLFELKLIYGKLEMYPTIFSSFYNSGVISDEDALEYHIHSFFADVYAYREKVAGFLGKIRNSTPKEQKENRNFLDITRQIFLDNFEPITKIRTKHTHGHVDNGWYLDDGSQGIRNHKSALSLLNTDGIKETVNWEYVNKKMAKKEEEAIEELKESKERWVKNSSEILSMINGTVPKMFDPVSSIIYGNLYIDVAAKIVSAHFVKP